MGPEVFQPLLLLFVSVLGAAEDVPSLADLGPLGGQGLYCAEPSRNGLLPTAWVGTRAQAF